MKCRHCNADIEQDAQFCPFCGKAIEHGKVCAKCGKYLDDDSDFCPYCGTKQGDDVEETVQVESVVQAQEPDITQDVVADEPQEHDVKEQPQEPEIIEEYNKVTSSNSVQEDLADTVQPYENSNGSKKWLWIIIAILLLGILGGGGYYYLSNKDGEHAYIQETDSIAEVSDSVISDIHSVKGIKSRLNEILSQALKMYDDEAVNKFFSQNFIQLYSQVKKNDATLDEPGFWCGSIWDGSQDDEPNGYEIVSVSTSSPTEAYVDVNLTSDYEGRHRERKMSMSLVFENENWFIDDILDFRYKDEMKKYIDSFEHESLISIEKMRNASIDETMPSQGFTKIYVPSEREGYGTDVWYKNCEIDKEGNVHSANENSCVVEVFDGMSASLRITIFDKTKFESIKEQVLEYSVKTDNRDYFKWKDNETTHLPISIGKSVNFKGGFFVEIPLD